MASLIPIESVVTKIFVLRKEKVMIDRDLAGLYGVTTKVLNQAVKRNQRRFPDDFMFTLTAEEKHQLVTNCDRFKPLKHSSASPRAFTEQGVAMLSSVLNSERAIGVNISIMRAFVHLRKMIVSSAEVARRFAMLEQHLEDHDEQIRAIFEAMKQLMAPPATPRKRIGFEVREPKVKYGRSGARGV